MQSSPCRLLGTAPATPSPPLPASQLHLNLFPPTLLVFSPSVLMPSQPSLPSPVPH
ncbi:hypothetical protein BGX38DRAFT_1152418 [Terfezia claveryi]|nr:hypothetical protein BGX38DRAFT_1152418 [Terfezia claveryi]